MPSNGTSAAAEAAAPALADLTVSELTAALGASDMPARGWRSAPRGQLGAWAQQGLDRRGIQAVRETAERTADLDYAERGTATATPAERAELRGMWPSTRRLDAARDGAYQLRQQLVADRLGVPDREVSLSSRPAADAVAPEPLNPRGEARPAEAETTEPEAQAVL